MRGIKNAGGMAKDVRRFFVTLISAAMMITVLVLASALQIGAAKAEGVTIITSNEPGAAKLFPLKMRIEDDPDAETSGDVIIRRVDVVIK